jgi:nucleoside-diphosphate-sugar epimerase
MKKQTILLTGASGEVGFEAFKELFNRRQRYNIRLLNLDHKFERQRFAPYNGQVEIVYGDLRNPDTVQEAVRGVDGVIHAAALIPPLADENPGLARAVNVGGTRSLVAALTEQNPAARLVYTSSISVYGDRVENPQIRVGDPLEPSDGDEYAKTKVQAEELIQASGLKWTILRLSGILTERLHIQPLMFHMPLNTALEWCHSSDAGLALVQALEHEGVLGRIFNLGGGDACRISAREFLYKMLPLFGVDAEALPEQAFATRNFHSGDYADGDELDALLDFRRKTLTDYFEMAKKRISPASRALVRMIPNFIVRAYFTAISDPLKAIRRGDAELIRRYFGSLEAFNILSLRAKRSSLRHLR